MNAFIDKYLPQKEGEIVLKNGEVIGSHNGIQHFTIGQRKGLGIAWEVPLHVVEIDASLNRVIVAPREDSGKSECIVKDINWVSIEAPQKPIEVGDRLVLGCTNKNDIILDPFSGSGTFLVSAKKHSRKYIGIETEEMYVELSRKRLKSTKVV